MSIVEQITQPQTAQVIRLLIIHDEATYQEALQVMEHLMLTTPDTSDNPANLFMELLAEALERYEDKAYGLETLSPMDTLKELMTMRKLKQKDLADLLNVSPGLISDIFKGNKKLTLSHVQTLAAYFKVSPAVFIE